MPGHRKKALHNLDAGPLKHRSKPFSVFIGMAETIFYDRRRFFFNRSNSAFHHWLIIFILVIRRGEKSAQIRCQLIRTLYHLGHHQDRSLQVKGFEGFCIL